MGEHQASVKALSHLVHQHMKRLTFRFDGMNQSFIGGTNHIKYASLQHILDVFRCGLAKYVCQNIAYRHVGDEFATSSNQSYCLERLSRGKIAVNIHTLLYLECQTEVLHTRA
jgi:hypothetical protein